MRERTQQENITIRLGTDLLKQLDEAAWEARVRRSEMVREMVKEGLARLEDKKANHLEFC